MSTRSPAGPSNDSPSERADSSPVQYRRPISQWKKDERPRERLLDAGAEVLTDSELLGIVLGTGARTSAGTISAVELGRILLESYGKSLRTLARREVQEWREIRGVGEAKAVRLAAVFEIGRRIEAADGPDRCQVCSPDEVAAIYGPKMRDLKQEIFRVVLLNTASVVLGDFVISEGGLASSIVEPRAVFRKAVLENAASIICVHNHPSGNPEPSREDIRITRRLVEAGKVMGIPVQDHLIIANRSHTSLAERGVV